MLLPNLRPTPTALAFVLGAYLTVLVLGGVVFLAADAAADVVSGGLVWLRRIAFGLAAVALLWSAVRRLRSYRARSIALPSPAKRSSCSQSEPPNSRKTSGRSSLRWNQIGSAPRTTLSARRTCLDLLQAPQPHGPPP